MTQPEVCVFLPMYQENGLVPGYIETAIQRVLRNLKEHDIPLVLVGDTRYNYFPDSGTYSTDGSREIVESYDNTLLFDKGNYTQDTPAQHNRAFKLAAEKGYKWLMVVGCDEYIVGDVNYMMQIANSAIDERMPVFNIKFTEHSHERQFIDKASIGFVQRLFAYPGKIETKYTHWTRYYEGRRMIADPHVVLDMVQIHHDSNIRPKERDDKMREYQIKCIEHEDTKIR